MYQELFEYMSSQHGLILLESEMQEIISIATRVRESVEIARHEEQARIAIDMGGGCSKCGDVSGFECICDEQEEDYYSLPSTETGGL